MKVTPQTAEKTLTKAEKALAEGRLEDAKKLGEQAFAQVRLLSNFLRDNPMIVLTRAQSKKAQTWGERLRPFAELLEKDGAGNNDEMAQ